jgi:hypothetical protein
LAWRGAGNSFHWTLHRFLAILAIATEIAPKNLPH